ncbi:MAG: class I SAM-dependent methyltransferase [Verrucomicrobiales bacterium]|nr:class I SAM-dependent methyltransferase [Verrucomicrobiales bacterium]
MEAHTKEPQYDRCLMLARERPTQMGLMSNQVWHDDPKRLGFVLARYKFVAKMLSGMDRVLEVGCADAFGTRVVQQEVKQVVATDFDPVFVEDVNRRKDPDWPLECLTHDMVGGPLARDFDAAYSVDVLEHIQAADEDKFIGNMARSISTHGVCVIGTPSLESQAYASPGSKAGHVNCKTGTGLRELMSRHFRNVFLFSMNDEVVHTGFQKMAHYLFAVCCSKR